MNPTPVLKNRSLLVSFFLILSSMTASSQDLTVPVLVGQPNRAATVAQPPSAGDLAALDAHAIETYGVFSVVRVPAARLDASRTEASRRGLRFEAFPEWDRVELPSATLQSGRPIGDGEGLWIVKFVAPEKPEWGDRIAALDLKYIQYFAHHAAVVYGAGSDLRSLARESFIAWVAPYGAAEKAQPRECEPGDNFTVQMVNLPDAEPVVARLRSIRRDLPSGPYRNVEALVPCDQLTALLAEPTVMAIERSAASVPSGERESVGVTTIHQESPSPDSTAVSHGSRDGTDTIQASTRIL
jgi:hypothetical protein